VERPNIPAEGLIREEERRCERLGLYLTQNYDVSRESPEDPVETYLIHERLFFSEKLLWTMMLPYSPCRVRDWNKRRHLWWLLGVSWQLIGAEQWRERERLRDTFPPGVCVG
jgi:hypothetical protein